jgi:hypothetical protein
VPTAPDRADTAPGPALPEPRWQQAWFAARRHPWSSLVVVPAHPGVSARFIAQALVGVGSLHGDRPVKLVDAEGTRLPAAASVLDSLSAVVGRGELAVVAVDDPVREAASIPIARAAEAALLVVPLGEGRFADARRAMDLVGRDRFIGAITLALAPGRKP